MTGSRQIHLVFAAALTALVVGFYPAAASAGSLAYIVSSDHQTLTVFDTATKQVVTTVSVTDANRVAISPDGTRAFVTAGGASGAGSVLVFNTSNHSLVTTINVGTDPRGVVFSHDGTRAYVANYRSNSVSVINTSDYSVSTISSVGTYVPSLAVSPDGSKVYAANEDGLSLSIISTSTNTVTGSVDLGRHATGVAVSPDGSRVYVSSGSAKSVSVIDAATATVLEHLSFDVQGSPAVPIVSSDGNRLYVPISGGNLVVVDLETGAQSVVSMSIPTVVGDAQVAALSDDGLYLFVSVLDRVLVVDVEFGTIVDELTGIVPSGGFAIQFSGYSEGGGGGGGSGEGGGSGATAVPAVPAWALIALGALLVGRFRSATR